MFFPITQFYVVITRALPVSLYLVVYILHTYLVGGRT